MNETCRNESELFNQTLKTINMQKFYFDGVAVSIFGVLGLFGKIFGKNHSKTVIFLTLYGSKQRFKAKHPHSRFWGHLSY